MAFYTFDEKDAMGNSERNRDPRQGLGGVTPTPGLSASLRAGARGAHRHRMTLRESTPRCCFGYAGDELGLQGSSLESGGDSPVAAPPVLAYPGAREAQVTHAEVRRSTPRRVRCFWQSDGSDICPPPTFTRRAVTEAFKVILRLSLQAGERTLHKLISA